MRAINLVPADERPGRVNGGKSNGAVYGVLVGLIVVLVALSALALTKKQQSQATQDLAAVQQSTAAYNQVADQFSAYEAAASDATARISTVRGLAEARFDWAGAMRDISRVVPKDVQLTTLDASVKPGVSAGTGGTALRGAISTPAVTMTGCATNQDAVADLLSQLEALRRVTQVSLDSSIQAEGADEGCTVTAKQPYTFNLVVFYSQGKALAGAEAVPGSTPVTASLATESAGGASGGAATPPAGN